MIKQMISLLLYPFYMLQNSQLLLKIKMSARSYYWRKKFKFCDDGVWFDGISQIIGASSITIGSNTCVTRNVPPFCVVAGIPAKVIKQV